MKKNQLLWLSGFLFCSQLLNAQFTVTYKPNATQGQDAQLRFNATCPAWPAANYGNAVEINPTAWTYFGAGCGAGRYRSLVRFDGLNSLPPGSILQYAELRLYGVATSGNTNGNSSYPGAPFGTTNELWVRQVTSAWTESTVTWNTQPSFTTTGQISVPASTSRWNHNLRLNVTSQVAAMLAPGANNGFVIMLQNENYYRSMLFASSDHPDASRWPELYVEFSQPLTPAASGTEFSKTDLTGLSDAKSDVPAAIEAIPNPVTNGLLNVKVQADKSGKYQYRIVNCNGVIMLTGSIVLQQGNQLIPVNIFNLTPGNYWIEVTGGSQPMRTAFIKI
jgi:hypothetical protein